MWRGFSLIAVVLASLAIGSSASTQIGCGGGDLVLGGVGGGCGAIVFNAWNPATAESHLVISNNNLTGTESVAGGVYSGVLANKSASSGKFYWEITAVTISTPAAATFGGVGNASAAVNNYFGSTSNSIGWVGDGRVYINNINLGPIQTFAQGNTLCFALDLGNSKIWFRTNGGNWNNDVIANQNPATNTGGISLSTLNAGPYFALGEAEATNDVFTANFGATAFAQTAPAGFNKW